MIEIAQIPGLELNRCVR